MVGAEEWLSLLLCSRYGHAGDPIFDAEERHLLRLHLAGNDGTGGSFADHEGVLE